jgi:hypothetical protein
MMRIKFHPKSVSTQSERIQRPGRPSRWSVRIDEVPHLRKMGTGDPIQPEGQDVTQDW